MPTLYNIHEQDTHLFLPVFLVLLGRWTHNQKLTATLCDCREGPVPETKEENLGRFGKQERFPGKGEVGEYKWVVGGTKDYGHYRSMKQHLNDLNPERVGRL